MVQTAHHLPDYKSDAKFLASFRKLDDTKSYVMLSDISVFTMRNYLSADSTVKFSSEIISSEKNFEYWIIL